MAASLGRDALSNPHSSLNPFPSIQYGHLGSSVAMRWKLSEDTLQVKRASITPLSVFALCGT